MNSFDPSNDVCSNKDQSWQHDKFQTSIILFKLISRLPNGVGTRSDICELLKQS